MLKSTVSTAAARPVRGGRMRGAPLGQAAAARPHYDTDGAMVVTNAGFTAQAITLAGSADVELWDRDDIARELIDPRRGTPRHP
jgi:hypothetical protein